MVIMVEFENYSEPRYTINGNAGFIIGRSEVMIRLFHYLNQLANLPTTVLLRGETGTGKELFAKALHYNRNGGGRNKPFVTVNCAGIPESLLESELFGYDRGVFTGAYKSTQGKFEYANGGTIFLDEIGDMSTHLQAKILRVLQEREITPIGSNTSKKVDVRIVTATNRNLEEALKRGNFREDLHYRLNVFPIVIPPLRERREDIPLIAEYLVEKYSGIYRVNVHGLSAGAIERLIQYSWRGNVRELENIVERIFVRKSNGIIQPEDIRFDEDKISGTAQEPITAREPIVEYRQDVVDTLYSRMVVGGESFWDAVRPSYIERDISKSEVRELIRRGLTQTQGSYKILTRLFNIEHTEYKKFLNFLRKHRCQLRFAEFRPLKQNAS